MIAVRIIPCLDVRDGRVVKGVRFADLRELGDPVELALRYQTEGADELVILDVSATLEGRLSHASTISAVRRVLSIPLTTGGGVQTVADAGRLLDAGADKVAMNTAAVIRPELLQEVAAFYGSQCTVLALDAAQTLADPQRWEVVTHSGKTRTGIDAIDWAVRAAGLGAGEIVLTSWDRDGTRQGYDLELLRAISGAVQIPVIASGGANSAQDLCDGVAAGASAVLAASIFHEAEWSIGAVKEFMKTSGIRVRI